MNITFYTFSKRLNSTKQPTGGTNYDCYLKEPSSVLSPVIQLKTTGAPTAYNYAHISDFGRYYFVSDWTYRGGLWEATLSADALASWKTNIGNSEEYILRSSADYDLYLIDSMYPARSGVSSISSTSNALFDTENKYYVLGILGDTETRIGSVSYFAFDETGMRSLVNILMNIDNYSTFDFSGAADNWLVEFFTGCEGTIKQLMKIAYDPFKYIVSCRMYPFEPVGTSGTVRFGWWRDDVAAITCKYLGAGQLLQGLGINELTIPKHPDNTTDNFRGHYLNAAPYADYRLLYQPFGVINITADYLVNYDAIKISTSVDLVNGEARAVLETVGNSVYPSRFLASHTANIGVNIELTSINNNVVGQMGSLMNIANSFVTTFRGNVVGGVTSLPAGLADSILAKAPIISSTGTNGGVLNNTQIYYSDTAELITLIGEFKRVARESLEEMGRPLCSVSKISDIPGYIVCAHGDISLPATDAELKAIKNFMEGGFFYE